MRRQHKRSEGQDLRSDCPRFASLLRSEAALETAGRFAPPSEACLGRAHASLRTKEPKNGNRALAVHSVSAVTLQPPCEASDYARLTFRGGIAGGLLYVASIVGALPDVVRSRFSLGVSTCGLLDNTYFVSGRGRSLDEPDSST